MIANGYQRSAIPIVLPESIIELPEIGILNEGCIRDVVEFIGRGKGTFPFIVSSSTWNGV